MILISIYWRSEGSSYILEKCTIPDGFEPPTSPLLAVRACLLRHENNECLYYFSWVSGIYTTQFRSSAASGMTANSERTVILALVNSPSNPRPRHERCVFV